MQDLYVLLYVYQLSEERVKSDFRCSFEVPKFESN
jgi:hypothetical protein